MAVEHSCKFQQYIMRRTLAIADYYARIHRITQWRIPDPLQASIEQLRIGLHYSN